MEKFRERKRREGSREGTRSPCFSTDAAWGKLDKQADRRKWSSLCTWMARTNVQKASEEARSHSISLPPPRGMGLLDLSFPPQISLKLTKPMSQSGSSLTSTQDSCPSHKQA